MHVYQLVLFGYQVYISLIRFKRSNHPLMPLLSDAVIKKETSTAQATAVSRLSAAIYIK